MFNMNLTHADWAFALEQGMRSASTFRRQSNLIIMGAVVLFWNNSKNIAYLNSAVEYAKAYRGIRVEAVKAFLVHFTGAKFDRDAGKFVKGGKLKAMREGFETLDTWLDWADKEKPEPEFDAKKLIATDEKAVIRMLERKLDAAKEALALVEGEDEPDQDVIEMLQEHIAHTENLKAQAQAVYN